METLEIPTHRPLRLIQYLGSKLNVLDQILPEIKAHTPRGGTCLDIFSGTTVVGQGLLEHCSVYSNDSLVSSKLLGDVLIAGPDSGAVDFPVPDVSYLLQSSVYRRNCEELESIYAEPLLREAQILDSRNEVGLGKFCETLPTWWKDKVHWDGSKPSTNFVKQFDIAAKRSALHSLPACLFTTYYAGSYFGLRQAIELDSLRYSILKLQMEGELTAWQAKVLVVALIAATSQAVSSAGKHFAQPLIIHGGKQRVFALRRTLSDRTVSVKDAMQQALTAILQRVEQPRWQSRSYCVSFEELVQKSSKSGARAALRAYFDNEQFDSIYADPPYTAQQYSRFYHILDTLILYDYPNLQRHLADDRRFTQGLYREDRHKSVFCSKRTAPEAFDALVAIAAQASNCLILSYSSTNKTSGNPRMIDAGTIISIGRRYFSRIKEHTLHHKYRKLNRDDRNRKSGDPEKLYIFSHSP